MVRSAVSSTSFGLRSWMSHGRRVQVQRVAMRHLPRPNERSSGCLKLGGSERQLRRARSRSAGLRNDKQRRLSVGHGSEPSRSSWRSNSGLMGCSRCSSPTSRTSDGRYATGVSVCLSGPRTSLRPTVSCSGGAGIRAAGGAQRSSRRSSSPKRSCKARTGHHRRHRRGLQRADRDAHHPGHQRGLQRADRGALSARHQWAGPCCIKRPPPAPLGLRRARWKGRRAYVQVP